MTGIQKGKTKSWTTWFASDHHFGHANVIDFCNRPFSTIQEMDQSLIDNHNRLVKPEDLVIFVGDVFMYCTPDRMKEVVSQLNGERKILVIGNHDKDPRAMMNLGFDFVVSEMSMKIADETVLFSHYPFRMGSILYQWVKFKSRVFKLLNKIGIKVRRISPERYHNKRPVDRGQFLIHGHTHNSNKINGRAIHVGVDAWNYKPVNIQQISNLISQVKKHGPKYHNVRRNED